MRATLVSAMQKVFCHAVESCDRGGASCSRRFCCIRARKNAALQKPVDCAVVAPVECTPRLPQSLHTDVWLRLQWVFIVTSGAVFLPLVQGIRGAGLHAVFFLAVRQKKAYGHHGVMPLHAPNSMQLCGQRLRERSGGCVRNERQRLHGGARAPFCVHVAQTPSKLKDFSCVCGHAWGCVCCWQKER